MYLLRQKESYIKDYESFFKSYGGFHDAKLANLFTDFREYLLRLTINDPLINFKDFKDYN